jgi:hypothetical protein
MVQKEDLSPVVADPREGERVVRIDGEVATVTPATRTR